MSPVQRMMAPVTTNPVIAAATVFVASKMWAYA